MKSLGALDATIHFICDHDITDVVITKIDWGNPGPTQAQFDLMALEYVDATDDQVIGEALTDIIEEYVEDTFGSLTTIRDGILKMNFQTGAFEAWFEQMKPKSEYRTGVIIALTQDD